MAIPPAVRRSLRESDPRRRRLQRQELHAAETRLRFRLPGSLREAYALIGTRFDLTRVQDRLLAPHQAIVGDTGQVLVFRLENQNVAQWGIPLSAVTEPDPPVVFRLDSAGQAERAWQPYLERVSLGDAKQRLHAVIDEDGAQANASRSSPYQLPRSFLGRPGRQRRSNFRPGPAIPASKMPAGGTVMTQAR